MESSTKFTLINGNYSPKDAEEILLNAYASKIKFHETKNLSSQVRLGVEDSLALKKIPQLNNSMKEISKLIEEAVAKNKTVIIASEISISFSDHQD
jgi:hypothetical protein